MKYIMLCCLVFLMGCTTSGSYQGKHKIMSCVDTRDGEKFSFSTKTLRKIRVGYGSPGSVTITTLKGKVMSFTTDSNAWLKCSQVKEK